MDNEELERRIKVATRKPRQRAWLLAYLSDPKRDSTAAARQAGYEATGHSLNTRGSRLKKLFREIIDSYDLVLADAAIVSPREVQTGIAAIARDTSQPARERLKAYELIARIHGMLTDQIKFDGNLNVKQAIMAAIGSVSTVPSTLPVVDAVKALPPVMPGIEVEE